MKHTDCVDYIIVCVWVGVINDNINYLYLAGVI